MCEGGWRERERERQRQRQRQRQKFRMLFAGANAASGRKQGKGITTKAHGSTAAESVGSVDSNISQVQSDIQVAGQNRDRRRVLVGTCYSNAEVPSDAATKRSHSAAHPVEGQEERICISRGPARISIEVVLACRTLGK